MCFLLQRYIRATFICFSFVAGKEIVKYIASVLNVALGTVTGKWLDALILGRIHEDSRQYQEGNRRVWLKNWIPLTRSCYQNSVLVAFIPSFWEMNFFVPYLTHSHIYRKYVGALSPSNKRKVLLYHLPKSDMIQKIWYKKGKYHLWT